MLRPGCCVVFVTSGGRWHEPGSQQVAASSILTCFGALCVSCGCFLLQVAKAVEDILYAATQEEGEACLAAAMAELELRGEELGLMQHPDAAAAAEHGQQQMEDGLEQLQDGLEQQHQQQQMYEEQQGVGAGGFDQQQVGAGMPVC